MESITNLPEKMTVKLKDEGSWDDTQLRAIHACLDRSHRVVPITGEAGTGKTSILRTVHEELVSAGYAVVLCAPTGKAAKRITEATGIEAVTIHRLLEYPYPGEIDEKTGKPLSATYPRRDHRNPLEYDVILADEYAMVASEVHRNLFDALPAGGRICVFGDANQLAPIEASEARRKEDSPFEYLLKKFNGIRLKKIHRQAEGSSIIFNCHRILEGQIPIRKDDFTLMLSEVPIEAVTNLVMDGLDTGRDFGALNCQVITPTRIGWVGSTSINSLMQSMLQPSDKESVEIARHPWAEAPTQRIFIDDKVIFTVNNYGLGIFNGETGIVRKIDYADTVHVDFGDKEIGIPVAMEVTARRGTAIINPQKDLDLAYAITTHKAQGSEYEDVLYVINKSRPFMLCRRNFYTAVSRARKRVCVIADKRALSLSLFKVDSR